MTAERPDQAPSEPAPLSMEPSAGSAAPEPVVAWDPPAAPTPDQAAKRPLNPLLETILWIAGVAGILILSTVYAAVRYPAAPGESVQAGRGFGVIVGAALTGLAFAFLVRGAWVWWGRRSGTRRHVLSPMVLLLASVFIFLAILGEARQGSSSAASTAGAESPPPAGSSVASSPAAGSPAAGQPRGSAAIDSLRAISDPFSLRPAEPAETTAMEQILRENAGGAVNEMRVDRVFRDDRFLGFLAVIEIPDMSDATSALALAGMESEVQKNKDATWRRATFNGRSALVVELGGSGLALWTEDKYVKMVFSTDTDDTVPIAEAAARPR